MKTFLLITLLPLMFGHVETDDQLRWEAFNAVKNLEFYEGNDPYKFVDGVCGAQYGLITRVLPEFCTVCEYKGEKYYAAVVCIYETFDGNALEVYLAVYKNGEQVACIYLTRNAMLVKSLDCADGQFNVLVLTRYIDPTIPNSESYWQYRYDTIHLDMMFKSGEEFLKNQRFDEFTGSHPYTCIFGPEIPDDEFEYW